MNDALGQQINVGDHVAIAFSYSRASVGHLRFGTVLGFEDVNFYSGGIEHHIWIRWDEPNKKDAKIKYAGKRFLVIP